MRRERDDAIACLEHNMGVANRAARTFQRERDQVIRKLRERHSCIEIAEQFGLTRQRVHQILNEAPEGFQVPQPCKPQPAADTK
jgi:hypothetical protein